MGLEFFEVTEGLSKSSVLAGEIMVNIDFFGAQECVRILDLGLGWNGHVMPDVAKSKRKSEREQIRFRAKQVATKS